MGAFSDARKKAREEAGMDRMKATEKAKMKIGSVIGKTEARFREPLRDKAVRAVSGSPRFFKKVGRGAKAIGGALNSAGKKFSQKTNSFEGQNTQLKGGGSVRPQLGGSLGQSILGEEKPMKKRQKTVTIKIN